jgi:phosphotransferase system enzyme I (PtsI)
MKGIPAVSGMALDKALVFQIKTYHTDKQHVSAPEEEVTQLKQAAGICGDALQTLMELLENSADPQTAGIVDFQLLLLSDAAFMGYMEKTILTEHVNASFAVADRAESYRQELASLDNAYLRERVTDVADLEHRLLAALQGESVSPDKDGRAGITVAEDLTPTQVVELGREKLRGIVLEKGGLSSHNVILARSMGIPCIIGVQGLMEEIKDGEPLLLDGFTGEVVRCPTATQEARFRKYDTENAQRLRELDWYRGAETVTKDGYKMKIFANISTPEEIPLLIEAGAEGVGLFRTELLYMSRNNAPNEKEQYEIYSKAVRGLAGRPLIIRTLDVGGDKKLPYLNIPQEENPYLGYRAIRYCLDHPEIFKPQISALLRAACEGNVDVMIPMVATVSELERTETMIREVKNELAQTGTPHSNVRLGMMIETPAAAIMADRFAGMVDFFSIGTNDLTQYLFAADRNNGQVASLNNYCHPALLRLIKYVCDCSRAHDIEVDICGQAGEMELLIPLWVAMGVHNLSVSIPSVTQVRRLVCQCERGACQSLLERVLALNTAEEAETLLREEVF